MSPGRFGVVLAGVIVLQLGPHWGLSAVSGRRPHTPLVRWIRAWANRLCTSSVSTRLSTAPAKPMPWRATSCPWRGLFHLTFTALAVVRKVTIRSSPPLRGVHGEPVIRLPGPRTIPAPAGRTTWTSTPGLRRRDDPRACGALFSYEFSPHCSPLPHHLSLWPRRYQLRITLVRHGCFTSCGSTATLSQRLKNALCR